MATTTTTTTPKPPPPPHPRQRQQRRLYGGSITVDLPADLIDSSTLRQIPDHQEVYLSSGTLTSVVFEVNEYLGRDDDEREDGMERGRGSGREKSAVVEGSIVHLDDDDDDDGGKAAVLRHLRDVVDADGDVIDQLVGPERVWMRGSSVDGLPAFYVRASLVGGGGGSTTTDNVRGGGNREKREREEGEVEGQGMIDTTPTTPAAAAATATDATKRTTTAAMTIRLLLVRLAAQKTDLCVFVNVPWKEFRIEEEEVEEEEEGKMSGAVEREEEFAQSIVEDVVQSLRIWDFGLFDP